MNNYFHGQYNEQGFVKMLDAFNCFEEHRNSPKIIMNAFRFLIKYSDKSRQANFYNRMIPTKEQLFKKAQEYIRRYIREDKRLDYAREIADTLLTFFPDYQQSILKCLDDEENPSLAKIDEKEKSVYVDGQNVHNKSITNSMITAGTNLCSQFSGKISLGSSIYFNTNKKELLNSVEIDLICSYPNEEELIRTAIKYISENPAGFGPKQITITDIFLAVWFWIKTQKYTKELHRRLLEELKEMKGMCSSGHIARLVNVIQGFTDDERFIIRISDEEQCRTVVKTYLNKVLQNCSDEDILNGLIDHNNKFINFIRTKIGDRLLEWRKEYGPEFIPTIGQTVNDYCKYDVFKKRER